MTDPEQRVLSTEVVWDSGQSGTANKTDDAC